MSALPHTLTVTERLRPLLPPRVTLREEQPADYAFLEGLYASTRHDELAPVPWTDDQKRAFLAEQFRLQTQHYREHYPNAERLVVRRDGRDAGRLYTHITTAELRIMDIALLPEHRRHGTGSALLHALQTVATDLQRPLGIHVERMNPALRLYARLGFLEHAERGVYLYLVWTPTKDATIR